MRDDENGIASGDAEALHKLAIQNVLALKRENAPRISDASWISYTGYNYGRWADRGFNIALGLLGNTAIQVGEAGPDYLRRVIALVRAQRDEYRADAADEDGACSGALDAASGAIIDALPQEPHRHAPDPSIEWKLWYRDTFDRETPVMLEATGRGIVEGLVELWQHILREGVVDSGSASFSRFHLTLGQEFIGSVTVPVAPFDNHTLAKLRRWVYPTIGTNQRRTKRIKDAPYRNQGAVMLEKLARLHWRLLRGSDRWTGEALSSGEESKQLLAQIEPMEHPGHLLELEEDAGS